jgi:16S rRNA processing protein RimM
VSSEQWVAVGRVGRPHGLDGSFVVEDASQSPQRLAIGALVYVGREPARVVAARRARDRPVIRLDRPVPRGSALEVRSDELPPPEDDAYYVFQLVGLTVEEEDGRVLGVVREVEAGIANDVLELESGVALPLVAEAVRSVDLEAGRIVVAPGFALES